MTKVWLYIIFIFIVIIYIWIFSNPSLYYELLRILFKNYPK